MKKLLVLCGLILLVLLPVVSALGCQPQAETPPAQVPAQTPTSAPTPSAYHSDFFAEPTECDGPTLVQFTGQSTGEVTKWAWDFNDDGIIDSNEENPTYYYNTDGSYSVTLTITGPSDEDTLTKPDYIHVAGCQTSNGRITVDEGMKVRYWRNYPLGNPNSAITRAVIVIHGMSRNADDYFSRIVSAARTEGVINDTIILAPRFITLDDDPKTDELFWSQSGWKIGHRSRNVPRMSSSFAVIDRIIEELRLPGRFTNLRSITVVGHSAGGQFVQRYAAGNQVEQSLEGITVRYVVANPSSYMYLNAARRVPGTTDQFSTPDSGDIECADGYNKYKYGLDKRNSYMSRVTGAEIRAQYAERNVVYLLGGSDNDPEHPDLDTSCPAMLQGNHRLERGIIFFNYLRTIYTYSNHELVLVPEVGHSSDRMFNSSKGRKVISP